MKQQTIWAQLERPEIPEFLTLDEAAQLLRVDGLSLALAVSFGDVPVTLHDGDLLVDSTRLFACFGVELVRSRSGK